MILTRYRHGAALGLLALLLTTVPPQAQTAAPPAAERLLGQAARDRLIGNTISGTTPDGPYSEFYAADGSMRHRDRDGPSGGHWRLEGTALCLDFPEDEEDCRRLEVDPDGRRGAFVDSDGSVYGFEILPGNPDGL